MLEPFSTAYTKPAEAQPASGNFHPNDRGGITYTPSQRVGGGEVRSELLADVRVLADATHDLCVAHRNFWPDPYPVPDDVHCALLAADYGLARVRAGTLKRLAARDNAPYQPLQPSRVNLADLINIADAADEMNSMRRFYVDQPSEQKRIASMVERLRDIVERASGMDAGALKSESTE